MTAIALQHWPDAWVATRTHTKLSLHPEEEVGARNSGRLECVGAARGDVEPCGTRLATCLLVAAEEHRVADSLTILVHHADLRKNAVVASCGTHNVASDC
jgi:hypothetical protein